MYFYKKPNKTREKTQEKTREKTREKTLFLYYSYITLKIETKR